MDLAELLETLKTYDEITLLEILDLTSEDLVDCFQDFIEKNQANLIRKVNG